jgi:DNA-binding CsgD family transcriptional regulator
MAGLAFAGTGAERRAWRAQRIADFGDPLARATGAMPYLWFVTTGIGAAWAGEAAAVGECADRLAAIEGGTWREQAVAWLRALAAGARGEANADALLAVGELPGIAALQDLGASAYVARLLPAAAEAPAADPLAVLSDREREVATLLLEGLSYAQIARELYVTRSTVAFHLSNVYAKTGTTSRHELVQRVRASGLL